MAVTGINNSNYTTYYNTGYNSTVKTADYKKESTSTKDGNIVTSTVELKTSRAGVTKTEQIKTGYSNINDYSKYLQGKYSYMNTGTTSMQGIPTTVTVSGEFLKKCANDPEKAKYLEENLAAIPDCAKLAVNGCLGTLTNLTYSFDADGNITITGSSTNDPDGKIARENAKRKAKENKEKQEKIKENIKNKKAEEKRQAAKLAEERKTVEMIEEKQEMKRAEKQAVKDKTGTDVKSSSTYTINDTGTDVKAVTQNIISASKGIYTPEMTAFDVRA